ncbi:MAG: response regulator [Beijerinckiaceae bacterium]
MREPGGPEERPSAGSSSLILIVEDEVFIALEVQALLLNHGFRVLGPAPSVEQALALLAANKPDAAVLDVSLRGELVSPVAEALRRMRVPFVVTSAYDRPDRIAGEVLTGAPHLGKPTSDGALLRALESVLDRE